MPRLLLVDDNPSIHKIAETLLASTSIDLTCLESGEEALRRVEAGERFDVALIDTAMIGMDGWTLLSRLRELPSTARIPVAMMAGVLDSVDPQRLEQAPIQGFLKKPVELRELGDRVQKLLETPVPLPPSAVATVPDTPVAELLAAQDEDVLVLGPEDLFAEPGALPAAPDESLELEELDLESLQSLPGVPVENLAFPGAAGPSPAGTELLIGDDQERQAAAAADVWADEAWDRPTAPKAEPEEVPFLVTADELPDLGDLVAAAEAPTLTLDAAPAPSLEIAPLDQEGELSLEEELDLGPAVSGPEPIPVSPPTDEFGGLPPAALAIPAAGLALGAGALALREGASETSAPPVAGPAPSPPEPSAAPALPAAAPSNPMLQALLQDPAAMDALARALVERLGEKNLREIAWEVMPELAARLKV
ncbi:MAG: response regulator [Acidobacteria bacterium]|nr:response regulator [Acidobacteriota bacterium]